MDILRIILQARTAGDVIVFDSYNNALGRTSKANLNSDKLIRGSRRTAIDAEVYRAGISLGSIATGGGTVPDVELFLMAENNNGVASGWSSNEVCHHPITDSFSTAQELILSNASQALQTSLALGSLHLLQIFNDSSLTFTFSIGKVNKKEFTMEYFVPR